MKDELIVLNSVFENREKILRNIVLSLNDKVLKSLGEDPTKFSVRFRGNPTDTMKSRMIRMRAAKVNGILSLINIEYLPRVYDALEKGLIVRL